MTLLSPVRAVVVFAALAFAYFLSTLVRAVTATLAPTLTQEFSLNASDLGLLAGGYFLGFAATQLPLGTWLDRYGPKRVEVVFLSVAVVGCVAFSLAESFSGLLLGRVLCGVGVSACLMAPLTGYRRWYAPANQMRANSWMLMVGALGMLASTLPVQWLVPVVGWRPCFWRLPWAWCWPCCLFFGYCRRGTLAPRLQALGRPQPIRMTAHRQAMPRYGATRTFARWRRSVL